MDWESRRFYGAMLETKKVTGKEGFGFKIEVRGRKVEVKPAMKFIREKKGAKEGEMGDEDGREGEEKKEEVVWTERPGMVHGGPQFRPRRQDLAVGLGYVYRWLDLNNLREKEVVKGVFRILLELEGTQFEQKVVRRILKRVKAEARCDLRELDDALRWPEDEKRRWKEEFDRCW